MAGIVANHQTGKNSKYFEIATSVRLATGMPSKKMYIRYIGKNPTHVDLDGIRVYTASKMEAHSQIDKIEELREKIKSIPEKDLFSGPGSKKIREQQYMEALATSINTHGHLNGQHLRWLREHTKLENHEINIYELDKIFDKNITNDEISKVILKLTGKDSKEYFEDLNEINKLKEIIYELEKRQMFKADMSGFGGAYDPTKTGADEYKRDQVYSQDSISGKIQAFNNELQILENRNKKFEKENKKELLLLEEFVKTNKINDIRLNIDINFDHRHHINDVMEIYAEAKRYKALQLAKLKFGHTATTDEMKVKFAMINEESPVENFIELQNVYVKTLSYDFASDYIDKKLFNPIAMKSYENGNTKDFLNKAVKLGYMTKQFVEREAKNTHIHFVPNFVDLINEGKSNLLRKYSGINKADMQRLVNHKNLDLVEKIHETNISRREMGKNSMKIKSLHKMWQKTLIENGIKNIKEFAFLLSLHSDEPVRTSCKSALNIMSMSDIYVTKDVIKESYTNLNKEKLPKKEKEVKLSEAEEQLKLFYGENWKEYVL